MSFLSFSWNITEMGSLGAVLTYGLRMVMPLNKSDKPRMTGTGFQELALMGSAGRTSRVKFAGRVVNIFCCP